jgi:hypothetical protein
MMHSYLEESPDDRTTQDSPSLPTNVWIPSDDDSSGIMVYWERRADVFDVVLQLIDPALLEDGDPGFIVWETLGPDRPRLPFSLRAEAGSAYVLSGRFEYRLPKEDPASVDEPPPIDALPPLYDPAAGGEPPPVKDRPPIEALPPVDAVAAYDAPLRSPPVPQLWLVNAVYPGGRTAAARIG